MDDSMIGVAMPLEDIAKKINEGKSSEITPDDIAAIAKGSTSADVWPVILLMLLPLMWGGKFQRRLLAREV